MIKKIIFFIVIILLVILATIYFVFNNKNTTNGTPDSRVGFSLQNFLPFGKSEDQGTNNIVVSDENIQLNNEDNSLKPVPRLRKISKEPVSGAIIFNVGSTSIVRFTEKGTGNVYEVYSDKNDMVRLTNTTIPKIIRSFWLPNGTGFITQSLAPESEIIETNFVNLKKNATSSLDESLTPYNTIVSSLPTGIKEIAIKPDGKQIFYYTISGLFSKWFVSNVDGTNAVQISSNPLTEWVVSWVQPNKINIQSKTSSNTIGYGYTYDLSTKVLKKTNLGALGLSLLPNKDGLTEIISSGGGFPQLYSNNTKDFSSKKIEINTLTDKCVWSEEKIKSIYCGVPKQIDGGLYPDSWYQGSIKTNDRIVKINIDANLFSITSDLSEESGEVIDITDLQISKDQNYLIFKNKIDEYLWMLRISE